MFQKSILAAALVALPVAMSGEAKAQCPTVYSNPGYSGTAYQAGYGGYPSYYRGYSSPYRSYYSSYDYYPRRYPSRYRAAYRFSEPTYNYGRPGYFYNYSWPGYYYYGRPGMSLLFGR